MSVCHEKSRVFFYYGVKAQKSYQTLQTANITEVACHWKCHFRKKESCSVCAIFSVMI